MYSAKILADSISPDGVRLTTMEVTFPRFILAEVNTHRKLSRNSASSRAIPPEKIIERVIENPFVPETFNARVKGMGVGEELERDTQVMCREIWLAQRDNAVQAARGLLNWNVDKSRINRLLEPFMWHTALISATDWDNFFALRCHPDAQPEFRKIAEMMKHQMTWSHPRELEYGRWHLPLVSVERDMDGDKDSDGWGDPLFWPMVSAGRCARVSFDTHGNYEDPERSFERAERLKASGHLSPLEHPAQPLRSHEMLGNYRGWEQLRKMIPHEENFKELEAQAA